MTSEKYVMYIVVNDDLKMKPGKIASQVGHVVQLITEEIIRSGYEDCPAPKTYFDYMKWKMHCTKIVLKGSTQQLQELIEKHNARFIIDDGQTQVEPNSLTVVGFPPSSELGAIVKDFKLLN